MKKGSAVIVGSKDESSAISLYKELLMNNWLWIFYIFKFDLTINQKAFVIDFIWLIYVLNNWILWKWSSGSYNG
jgi:hypothetical protein